MIDGGDLLRVFAFVDSIDDAVTATSGARENFELQTKGLAHPAGRVGDVKIASRTADAAPLLD